MVRQVRGFRVLGELQMFAVERIVGSRVDAKIIRHPGIVARADDRKLLISIVQDRLSEIANHWKTTTVARLNSR
jgi:hypothetical protein